MSSSLLAGRQTSTSHLTSHSRRPDAIKPTRRLRLPDTQTPIAIRTKQRRRSMIEQSGVRSGHDPEPITTGRGSTEACTVGTCLARVPALYRRDVRRAGAPIRFVSRSRIHRCPVIASYDPPDGYWP